VSGLICSLKGHRPGEKIIRNGGRAFARCARCGVDLIETDGQWRTPPKGARIVWRPSDRIASATISAPVMTETSAVAQAPELHAKHEFHAKPELQAKAELEAADEADQRENADRRERNERRKEKAPLPGFLRGNDRRSGQRDRRRSFGRRFTGE
jgi:hypothetical protein